MIPFDLLGADPMIPILINNRDLLGTVVKQVRFFNQIPHTLVCIIDNASTYPPLLDWYAAGHVVLDKPNLAGSGIHLRCLQYLDPPLDSPEGFLKVNLFIMPENRGPRASSIIPPLIPWDYTHYFQSDADLDYTGIDGGQMLNDLLHAFDIFPDIHGAGVSLRIDDLPPTQLAEYARYVEAGNWNLTEPSSNYYLAPCDTAGVLRRRHPNWNGDHSGVRSARHIARHIPWYFVGPDWSCPTCGRTIPDFIRLEGAPVCDDCCTIRLVPSDFTHFYVNASPAGTCYTARVLDTSRPL